MKKFLYIILSIFVLFISSYALFPTEVNAAAYPIADLGYCRDSRECFFYCQIPQNAAACWSYGKYVLRKNILGDSTSIAEERVKKQGVTFPIAELGNCANLTECKNYCAQTQNEVKCHDFASKKGLETKTQTQQTPAGLLEDAKETLGCTDADSCKALCQKEDNFVKCHTLAVKFKLAKAEDAPKKVEANTVKAARTALGCEDASTCRELCKKTENIDKCTEFAKQQGIIKETKENVQEKLAIMSKAKEVLGCESTNACAELCKVADNKTRCEEFRKAYIKNETGFNTGNMTPKPTSYPSGCTSDASCIEYCKKNPNECKGFNTSQLTTSSLNKSITGTPQSGTFMGPGGCKTEAECKAYCEKHPGECPGFPRANPSPSPKPTIATLNSTSNRVTSEPTPTVTPTIVETTSGGGFGNLGN